MIRTNKEQKTALSFLIFSKTFERLAFYLIITNLVFYLTESFQIDNSKAGLFYGLFYGSIGISTILFGLLGDFVNRQKLVKFGMFLTTVFYLVLIFLPATYVLQLIIFNVLGLSIGMTISNSIVFLGNIYNEKKTQTFGLSGFIFYSLAINFGAFVASWLSNTIKETAGYNPIFVLAFIFALISFVLYLFFDKTYSKLELFAEQRKNTEPEYKNLNITILISILIIGIILRIVMYQKGLTLNFYIRDYVENGQGFSSFLENLGKIVSILFLVIFGIIIIKLKKLNWNKLLKLIFRGSVIGSIVYIFIACLIIIDIAKISKIFTLNLYIILLVSETLIYSTIFYIVYRSSPIKFKGLFQGISYLLVSVSGYFLFIGTNLYEKVNPAAAFIVFSLIFLLCAGLVFILLKVVKRKEKELEEIDS